MSHFSAHSKAHIPKTKTHFAKCGYPKMTRNDARAPRARLGWGAQCAGPERRAETRRCRQDAALKRGTQEPEARGSIHPKLCLQSGAWRSLLLSISAVTALPAHRPLPATLSYCSEQLRAASTTPGEAGISWGHPLIAPPATCTPRRGGCQPGTGAARLPPPQHPQPPPRPPAGRGRRLRLGAVPAWPRRRSPVPWSLSCPCRCPCPHRRPHPRPCRRLPGPVRGRHGDQRAAAQGAAPPRPPRKSGPGPGGLRGLRGLRGAEGG